MTDFKLDIHDANAVASYGHELFELNQQPVRRFQALIVQHQGAQTENEQALAKLLAVIETKSYQVAEETDSQGVLGKAKGWLTRQKTEAVKQTRYELISRTKDLTEKTAMLSDQLDQSIQKMQAVDQAFAVMRQESLAIYEQNVAAVEAGDAYVADLTTELTDLENAVQATDDVMHQRLKQEKAADVRYNRDVLAGQVADLRMGAELVFQSMAKMRTYQEITQQATRKSRSMMHHALPAWRDGMMGEALAQTVDDQVEAMAVMTEAMNQAIAQSAASTRDTVTKVVDLTTQPTIRQETLAKSRADIIAAVHELNAASDQLYANYERDREATQHWQAEFEQLAQRPVTEKGKALNADNG